MLSGRIAQPPSPALWGPSIGDPRGSPQPHGDAAFPGSEVGDPTVPKPPPPTDGAPSPPAIEAPSWSMSPPKGWGCCSPPALGSAPPRGGGLVSIVPNTPRTVHTTAGRQERGEGWHPAGTETAPGSRSPTAHRRVWGSHQRRVGPHGAGNVGSGNANPIPPVPKTKRRSRRQKENAGAGQLPPRTPQPWGRAHSPVPPRPATEALRWRFSMRR